MLLYTSPNSNFGARVAIAAQVKGVTLELTPLPSGGLRSAEFLALNPLAKIPVLVLDDGSVLPESEVIVRYLDARYPNPALLPPGAEGRARIDLICRILELYVMVPIIRLFPHLNPQTRDDLAVAAEMARVEEGLSVLEHIMSYPLPEVPSGTSLADCMLAPALHLVTRIAAMLGQPADPVAGHPALVVAYRRLSLHPVIGPVLDELTRAQEAKDLSYGLPSLARNHRLLGGLISTNA